MTEARREDFWETLGDGGQSNKAQYREVSVRERISELLDHADEIHGIEFHDRHDGRIYGVVAYTTTGEHVDQCPVDQMEIIDYRSVKVDIEEEGVTMTQNGLWIPANAYNARALTQIAARASNDHDDPDGRADREPLGVSSIPEADADLILSRTLNIREGSEFQDIDKMERHPGIDPERSWGYGGGAPPEIEQMVDRLSEAGVETDRFIRLDYGKKSPWERANGELSEARPATEIMDNYGVVTGRADDPLVILDVDYPEEFPADKCPESFSVTSPHGSDERKHIFLRCDDKATVREELGSWAIQFGAWGECYVGGRYVVGPGSQLSAYGCDYDQFEAGEPDACDRCADPEGGYYRIVDDRPIATVDAETLIELATAGSETPDEEDIEEPAGRDLGEFGVTEDNEVVECTKCGNRGPRRQMETVTVLGNEHYRHRDECPEVSE